MVNCIELDAETIEAAMAAQMQAFPTPRHVALAALDFAHFRRSDQIHIGAIRIVSPDEPMLARTCSGCGNPITAYRLSILPHTLQCGWCARFYQDAPLLADAEAR